MIRPLLLEAPSHPKTRPLARARAFFTARWPGRIVAASLLAWLLDALLSLTGLGLPAPCSSETPGSTKYPKRFKRRI